MSSRANGGMPHGLIHLIGLIIVLCSLPVNPAKGDSLSFFPAQRLNDCVMIILRSSLYSVIWSLIKIT